MYHKKTKRVDARYYFVRELIEKGVVKIKKVTINDNLTDMGTKITIASKFKHCLDLLYVRID